MDSTTNPRPPDSDELPIGGLRGKDYKVLIADDHRLFRQCLAKILKGIPGIKKVQEAADGLEVINKLNSENWDLVLLDIEMPRMDGLSVLIDLKGRELPPIIIVSFHADEDHVTRAYNLGVKGYLHKDSDTLELKKAIIAVLSGKHYFSKELSEIVFENVVERDFLKEKGPKLTDKEIAVLKLICEQKTGKQISQELCLSFQTINSYRISLLRKTNSQNMAGLAIYAIEHGLYRGQKIRR